jgi:hypothetical protein
MGIDDDVASQDLAGELPCYETEEPSLTTISAIQESHQADKHGHGGEVPHHVEHEAGDLSHLPLHDGLLRQARRRGSAA